MQVKGMYPFAILLEMRSIGQHANNLSDLCQCINIYIGAAVNYFLSNSFYCMRISYLQILFVASQ